MPSDEIVKASALESMSPDDRQQLFDEHVITDLADVPTAFLERARSKGKALLAARGLIDPLQK